DTGSYRIENDPFLYVLNTRTKAAQKLCKHNSSWAVLNGDRQITHPHPSFTPNDDGVLFTSDFEGVPAIYIARVPESYKQ
ncbi:oligogalacturonate lyase family protein, partial [Staphylococcus aureus]|nr:oligogalacturonate lyase family protein [Staphylococcus aureus]